MKVLVLDGVSQKGVDILKEPGFQVDVNEDKLTEDQLVEIIGQYDAMIVRSATKVTARVIENATNMKVIGRAGVGVDNIDVAAATNRGVIVVNAPDGNTIAAAEHTLALMLALSRNVPQANENLKKGKWMRKEYVGVELRNKVLGVIGLGRIGTAVAKRAQGFEMETIGYDPYLSEERAQAIGVKLMPVEEVIKKADFLTVHLPLTKETRYLINSGTIETMKDGVRIINVARGGVIDEKALYEALKTGKVAGAAIDVFETEPTTESPLFELDNVVVTPHLGASTEEAQVNVALDVAYELVAILQGEMAKNAVNLPSIPAEVLVAVQPYLSLAEKLGKFIGQLADDMDTVEIIYSGEVGQIVTAPLTTTLLKGLLSTVTDESVNFVNVPIIAKSRGIKIAETKTTDAEDYANLITVKLKGGKQEKSVAGTLFQNNDARIVLIDGYRVDAIPEGHMIVAPHMDRPKIIGRVGTLIGEHDINIATMQVGRKTLGGQAVMVMGVDAPIPEETLAEISEIDGIIDVKFVSL
ncbi:MAG: phosphoglycerate dehydrogenase [Clostridia bacterium]|nr:phosphoglycerate dehydrogenase [Clostridia bacterium]